MTIVKIVLVFTFIFVGLTYFWYPDSIGIDQSMYLQAAELLLSGKKIYVDFIDINPPLIVYLNVPLAFVAKATGYPVILVFKMALLLFVGLMSFCLYKTLNEQLNWKQKFFLTWIFLLLSAVMMFVRAAGQREHLFILAFVPYFFGRLLNQNEKHCSQWLWVVIVLSCAITSFLKPHFLFLVLCLEMALIYLRRSSTDFVKRDFLIFGFIGLLYGAHFLFLPAEVRDAFFKDLIPLVMKYYDSFGKSFEDLLRTRPNYWETAIFCGLLLLLSAREDQKCREIKFSLGIVALGCVAIYFFQGKGWYYHLVPTIYITVLSVVFILPQIFGRVSFRTRVMSAIFSTLIFYFGISVMFKTVMGLGDQAYWTNFPDYGASEVEAAIRENSVRGDYVVVFSPSPLHSYPALLRLERYPGVRYLFQFPMSFFNNPHSKSRVQYDVYKTREQMSAEEKAYIERVESDIEQNQPKLIIFTNFRNEFSFLPKEFNSFQYFMASGLWRNIGLKYQMVSESPSLIVYSRK